MDERKEIREVCQYAWWYSPLDIFECRAAYSKQCDHRVSFGWHEYCTNPKFNELGEKIKALQTRPKEKKE